MTHVREAANQGEGSVGRPITKRGERGMHLTWVSPRASPFPLTVPDRERLNGAQQRLLGFSDCREVAKSDA